jgi:hypothetical protein
MTVVIIKPKRRFVVVPKKKPKPTRKRRPDPPPEKPRVIQLDPIMAIINGRCPRATERAEKRWAKNGTKKRHRSLMETSHQWYQLTESPKPLEHWCASCKRRIKSETRNEAVKNPVTGLIHYRRYVQLLADNQQPLPVYAKPKQRVVVVPKKKVVVIVRRKHA